MCQPVSSKRSAKSRARAKSSQGVLKVPRGGELAAVLEREAAFDNGDCALGGGEGGQQQDGREERKR